ncbi:MAG: pantetheine-phosphate adenylyltransferase [Endomicrobium sp.]|nr:pantetheine-phosphate adenylyltransferase [Endomicrobium sp.]
MKRKILAVYPGSFDPPTNGHLNIVKRTLQLFPKLVIAITQNVHKTPLFSLKERLQLLKKITSNLDNVEVISFSGLLVDYLKVVDAFVVIRGLRVFSDFERELQMALINRKLNKNIETVFLIPDHSYTFLSSSAVKELAMFGTNVSEFVPKYVEIALKKRIYCNLK